MARTRIWGGNFAGVVGVFADHRNWETVNVRASAYAWTASGSGTNEYYVRTAAGGNPWVGLPDEVKINGAAATQGTPGSLAAGQWGHGDNDSLGYSTLYVRLSDGTDPDSKAAGYVTYTGVPRAGEHVSIPVGSANIIGTDYSAVALSAVRFEDGTAAQAGSAAAALKLTCSGFYFAGKGTSYIDLAASAIAPEIRDTGNAPSAGLAALYLTGTAITTLMVLRGAVAFAWRAGESGRVNTIEVLPATGATATLWVGPDVTDVAGSGDPDVHLRTGATVVCRCNVDALLVEGGDYTQQEGVWASGELMSGTVRPDGAGTYAATLLAGAALKTEGSANLKTFTDCTARKGSSIVDPARRITWTNPVLFPDGIAGMTLDFGSGVEFTPAAA